jgi:hypothetical protein
MLPFAPNSYLPESEIRYEGHLQIRRISNKGAPAGTGLPSVEISKTSGIQQLVVLLPQPANSGYSDLVVSSTSYGVISHEQVQDRVQVSVMILFDTQGWPPGRYLLLVRHRDSWFHEIALNKSRAEPPVAPDRSVEKTYRNGRGGRTPEVEFLDRSEKAIVEIAGSIRSGTITYMEERIAITFWYEMGDGTCLFYINLPTPDHWEASTGTALSRRNDIVDFVAEAVSRKHAPGVKYSIARSQITYHARS